MEHLIKWLKENGYYEDYKKALRIPSNQLSIEENVGDRGVALYDILNYTICWASTRGDIGVDFGNIHRAFHKHLRENALDARVTMEQILGLSKESPYAKMIKFAKESHGTTKKNT